MTTSTNPRLLESMVSIYSSNNKFIGSGFLIRGGLILTCAHIFERDRPGKDEVVPVRYYPDAEIFTTKLIAFSDIFSLDLAILQPESAPRDREGLSLATQVEAKGHDFTTAGPLRGRENQLIFAKGKILGIVTIEGNKVYQLSSDQVADGFSGSPVWDDELGAVIGIITSRTNNATNQRFSFALRTDEMKEFFPNLKTIVFASTQKNSFTKQNNDSHNQFPINQNIEQPIAESAVTSTITEVNKPPKTDSDRPAGLDRLNYTRYAQSFVRIILNHETSTPLTIGVYGQWGQGKSFLMGKVKEALNDSVKKKVPFSFSAFWKKYNPKAISESLNLWLDKITFAQIDISVNSLSNRIIKWNEQFLLFVEKPNIIAERYINWINFRRKRRKETVDFHIVEFNAWAYVGTDHLWAGLVTHLYKEIEKYFGLRVTLERIRRAINKSLPKFLPIFFLYGLLGMGIYLVLNLNQKFLGSVGLPFQAFAGVLLGSTAIAGLPVLLTTLKEFVDNLFLANSKNLQNLAAKPDFKAQIGIMADIKDEIRFMGELLRKGKYGHPTRFILFIDDLDRCEHKKAVEVMQAIMLLLTDEDGAPFVIFMGIDARVIVHAIEETYGEVLVKAGINGYEYLDKIVQIPFVIPGAPLEDIQRYVDSMLWSEEEKDIFTKKKALTQPAVTPPLAPPVGDEPSKSPEVTLTPTPSIPVDEISVSFTEIERTAINECARDLSDNPRKIKRIINIYRYARLILPAEQDRAKAIRWYLMVEQWPLHVAWILEYIENDQQQIKQKLKDKKISNIYKLAKKNIRSKEMEPLLTIDADPDKFAAFIKKEDFTVQEVLALLPITFNLNPAIRSEVSKQMLKVPETKPKRKKSATRKKPVNTVQSV